MKNYNTTDLNPVTTFERHVFHRDQFAHYLRWTHVLNQAKIGDTVCDFGCGQGNMLEVLYRNKFKCKKYIGIDIRKQTIEMNKKKFQAVDWAEFICLDLIKSKFDYEKIQADKVCTFEVMEHVGKQNAQVFLKHFKQCGNKNATYYLTTPNFDPVVGAAGNHTYDSGDGRGIAVQELTHNEIQTHILRAGFKIINKFGTFASQKDYKHLLSKGQLEVFNQLKKYYDSNLIANIFAPMFPAESRNTMWVFKQDKL